jgi:hypothetical protein
MDPLRSPSPLVQLKKGSSYASQQRCPLGQLS